MEDEDLSIGEAVARERLVKLCVKIALDYGGVVGTVVEVVE